MENASKALLLAAGVLIGLILLSLGLYLYNTVRAAGELKSIQLSEEQLLKYNAEYEAFDKGRMYGTDVITVLNKARNNNEKYKNDESMFINVQFTLKNAVQNYVDVYVFEKNGEKTGWSKKESHKQTDYKELNYNLETGITYSLDDEEKKEEIEKFLKTQTDKSEYRINERYDGARKESNLIYYEMYYTGFSDFKRKIFKCDKINYKNGKVCEIIFSEVDIS